MNRKRYRRIVSAVLDELWLIERSKLGAICEVLTLRGSGVRLEPSEIAARIGPPRSGQTTAVGSQVALIRVWGTMAPHVGMLDNASGGVDTRSVIAAVQAAALDAGVGTIVLDFDTPGGAVSGVPELAEAIYAARRSKPVIGVANYSACSAGYWCLAACSQAVASPSARVGSQGVLYVHENRAAANAKAGVEFEYVVAGEFKAEGNPDGPLTDTARAHIQARVQKINSQFVSALARYRGTTAQHIETHYGQGRTLMADEALAVGMIDRIATLQDVLAELGAAPRGAEARAAHNGRGDIAVNKLHTMLIRLGVAEIAYSEEQVRLAAQTVLKARGLAVPADDAGLTSAVETLLPPPVTPPVAPPVAPPASQLKRASADDAEALLASVKLAGLADPMATYQTLLTKLNGGELTLKQAIGQLEQERIGQHRPVGSLPAAGPITFTENAVDKLHETARDALLAEFYSYNKEFGKNFKPVNGAREARSLANTESLARQLLIAHGHDSQRVYNISKANLGRLMLAGGSPSRYGLERAEDGPYNSSGMFSNILLDAKNVTLRDSYTETPVSFDRWAKRARPFSDFKAVQRTILGLLPDPHVIPEGGEFEDSTTIDGKESYKLVVWGRMISFTWESFVNDDLGAFLENSAKQGRAMRRKQNKLVYNVLRSNPTLQNDSLALFHASHGNDGSAAAFGETALNAARLAMASQTDINTGEDSIRIRVRPKFVIFSPSLFGTVSQVLNSLSAPGQNNSGVVNVWRNGLEPVEEEELLEVNAASGHTAASWYLAAASGEVDTIEYAFLDGLEEPVSDDYREFKRLAIATRIYQPFATAPIDFRGLYRNVGV